MAEVLLAAGSDLNIRNTDGGCSALEVAAHQGHVRILSFGAGSNAADDAGCTALHIAAKADQVEAVGVLINAGADIERKTIDNGSTPLLQAACSTACKGMRTLLQHGVAVNARDDDGTQPCKLVIEKTRVSRQP